MAVIYTRVTIEALNNIVSCAYEGENNDMTWDSFISLMPPPFDTTDLFYVAYEPDRNIYAVERRGGVVTGEESPEITWIRDNLTSIITLIQSQDPNDLN